MHPLSLRLSLAENNFMVKSILSSVAVLKQGEKRTQNKNRFARKLWWNEVHDELNDRYFKNKMRLKRETFNVILEKLCPRIELTPANIKPNPTSTHR